MNQIEKIRFETLQYFQDSIEIEGSDEVFISPSGNFKAITKSHKHATSNIELTKVDLVDIINSEKIFSFLVNESTFFHSWISKNKIEYLLCAEDLCGGQTVIDLTNRRMSSFTANDDGFIWTNHILSPNEKLLAVFGCGWGSAFFIVIYDFENPMDLPLRIVSEPGWTGYEMVEWIDNSSLKVKNSEIEKLVLAI